MRNNLNDELPRLTYPLGHAGSRHGIDIWLAFYDDIEDLHQLSAMRALLSAKERAQESKFYFPDDRKRYLVTRALVRTVLSRYADVAPAVWTFSANQYGRPAIAASHRQACGLGFNVSHTRGLIALGVTRECTLGIDVENLIARQGAPHVADRFFSPIEVEMLARVPAHLRHDRFFEYWTFKEAYIKARGMGLSLPLDRFSFHFPGEREVNLSIEPELGDDPHRWTFWQYRPTPDYLLALCAERLHGVAPAITIRKIVPTERDYILLDTPLLKTSAPYLD
jgi:4'-phosphopantetheinyl transferase